MTNMEDKPRCFKFASAIILLFLFSTRGLCASFTQAGSVYLSQYSGNDSVSDCGQTPDRPCKTFSRAVEQADIGDVIFVDGTETETNPYPCTPSVIASYSGIYVNKSVRFESYLTEVFIRCAEGRAFFIQGSNRSMLVSMTGFTFTNSTIRVVDSSISVVNCTFTKTERNLVLDVRYNRNSQGNVFLENCSFVRNFAPLINVLVSNIVVNFTLARIRIIKNSVSFDQTLITITPTIHSFPQITVQLSEVSARDNYFGAFFTLFHLSSGRKYNSYDTYHMMVLSQNAQVIRNKSSPKMKMDERQVNTTRRAVKSCPGSFSLLQSEFVNNNVSDESHIFKVNYYSDFTSKIVDTHFINNRLGGSRGTNHVVLLTLIGERSFHWRSPANVLISSCTFVASGKIVVGNFEALNVTITNSTLAYTGHLEETPLYTVAVLLLEADFGHIRIDGLTFMNNGVNSIVFSFLTLDMVISNSVFTHNQKFSFSIDVLKNSSSVSFFNSSFDGNTCDNTIDISEMISISFHELVKIHLLMQNITLLGNICAARSLLGIKSNIPSSRAELQQKQQKLHNGHRYSRTNANLPLAAEQRANRNRVITFKKVDVSDNISGLGGAILIQFGNVLLSDCTFKNNIGLFDSSCLNFQGNTASVELYNTYFLQTKNKIHTRRDRFTRNRFLSFANTGSLKISRSTVKLEEFGNIDAFLLIKSARSVEIENSTSVMCPIGTKIELRNLSFWEKMPSPNSLTRDLTYIFQCSACPIQTYSLKRGHSNGFTLNNDLRCRPCPTGANCSHNIAAKPNYWGFYLMDQDVVEFEYCPIGYCCPSLNYSCPFVCHNNTCQTGCQGNREGTLCGKCIDGHSQTLFSGQCRVSSECRDYWFWPLSISCALLFTSYLLWKSSILRYFKVHILWFLSDDSIVPRDPSRDSGYLKIVFYFYQVAGLLLVSASTETLLRSHIVTPLVELFNFKVASFNTGVVCPFSGLTALTKMLFEALLVPVMLLIIPLMYTVHVLWAQVWSSPCPSTGRYVAAAVEVFLLGYTVLASTSLKLLNCVTVESHSRWFYDGTQVCFQWWQGLSALFIAVFVVPFVMVLFRGTSLLHKGSMSAHRFLCAFGLPLPWVVSQTFGSLKNTICKSPTMTISTTQEPEITEERRLLENVNSRNELTSSVLRSLCAPFREPSKDNSGTIYWESVLIGRRFMLICLHTFIIDEFLRQILMSLTCLLILTHHMTRRPYRDPRANSLETVSLTTLIVIATLNLGYAAANSSVLAPSEREIIYEIVFTWIEVLVFGFVPFVILLAITLLLFTQVIRFVLMFVVYCLVKSGFRMVS